MTRRMGVLRKLPRIGRELDVNWTRIGRELDANYIFGN